MADTTATSCARALISHHIAQFGVPTDITSDRLLQFTSNLWTILGKLLGAQLHHTTAYHPQANGIIEQLHSQLKVALKARLVWPAWMDELPQVLLGLQSATKEVLRCAPAELVYGTTICLPGEFFDVHQQLSQICLICLHTFVTPWLDCGRSRHIITDDRPPTYLWSCWVVHLCSFVMTLISPRRSAPMMDPSKYLSEPQSFSH